MNKKKLKVLIIGPIAPPAGGISIHIQRLTYLLENHFHFDYIDESRKIKENVFNIRSMILNTYFKKVIQTDLLYIHSGNTIMKKIHIIIGRILNKKIIVMFHGISKLKKEINIIDKYIYLLANKIIVVNEEISYRLRISKNKYVIQHAFLPPIMKNEKDLPKDMLEKINKAKESNKIIISSNASRLNTFNNEDLYGLDLCIELANKLKKDKLNFIILFNVASVEENDDLYKSANDKIIHYELSDCFYLSNENISFVKLIELSDIILRTTNTDGDAITVREAIYFNKVIIASDIVKRPKGSILFKTRNAMDLYYKTSEQINLLKNNKKKNPKNQDSQIIHFFKILFEET